MRMSELFEQEIASVPAGTVGTIPPIQPTVASKNNTTNTATDVVNTAAEIQQNITNLKPTLAAAGGKTAIDAKALAQKLATKNPSEPMDPEVEKGVGAIIPSLTDILVDPEAARKLGQLIQSATRKP